MNIDLSMIPAAIISFFIAMLSGLGIGSGGLFVIWLTVVLGVDPIQARGMNLLFFVFSATAALIINLKDKRVAPKSIFSLSLLALIGAAIGTGLGSMIDASILRRIFGVFLVFSGIRAFGNKKSKKLLK